MGKLGVMGIFKIVGWQVVGEGSGGLFQGLTTTGKNRGGAEYTENQRRDVTIVGGVCSLRFLAVVGGEGQA